MTRASCIVLTAILLSGCASEQASNHTSAGLLRYVLRCDDPSLQRDLDHAAGFVVFPDVRRRTRIASVAACNGQVFKHGELIGVACLEGIPQPSGHTGSPAAIVIIRRPESLETLKSGGLRLCPDAIAVPPGSGRSEEYCDGVSIVVSHHELAGGWVGNRTITFDPLPATAASSFFHPGFTIALRRDGQ